MSFTVRNLTGSIIAIDDLGISLVASADLDLSDQQPQDIAISVDLITQITAGNVVVLNPLDGITQLNVSNSIAVVQSHNDPHWGIRGGTLNQLDDVDLTGSSVNDVLQLIGGTYVPVSPSFIANNIALDDLSDVVDVTGHTANTIYVFKGDGTNLNLVEATLDPQFVELIQDTIGNAFINGTDTTFVYNDLSNTLQVNVDDSFLRNTGDTLDSGTLTVASGANINIATGADLTIADAPILGTDAVNKDYVDSVASGLDVKESVRVATTVDVGATYSAIGGISGSGSLSSGPTTIDGVLLADGDRVLVKNQTDPIENGIYTVVSAIAGNWQRAEDQDGTPASEVSGGNFTFVEQGNNNENTGWVLQGDGLLTLNIDVLDWVKFSDSGQINAGIGVAKSGATVDLDVDNLTIASIVLADTISFHDTNGVAETSGSQTRKITAANFISDLNILTSVGGGSLTASDGVLITGNDVQLDITSLPAATIGTGAELVFDSGSTGTHNKVTAANFLADLDIVSGLAGNGIAVQTGTDTYTARFIVESTGAGLQGGNVVNGDGVAGNIEIGIDINNLTDSLGNMSASDELIVFNGANNVSMTGQQIANGVSGIVSGNNFGVMTGDTGTATASGTSDTISLVGALNGGITTIAGDGSPDAVTFALDFSDLATSVAPIALTGIIGLDDGVNNVQYTLQDVVDDLDIVHGIVANGLIVRTAADTYTSRSIVVDGTGALDGLAITDGDAIAGNPTIGLDIVNTPAAGEDLAATDEFIVSNTSALANETLTGQEVANGVSTILGLGGLSVTAINGQQVLTLVDTTRANKILSIETSALSYAENRIGNNDWIQIGNANDALSGFIMPMNATIVKISAHTSDDKGNTKAVDLYIDGTNNGTIMTFTAVPGENEFVDETLNIDVNQNQKIRLRAGATGGKVEDVVITVWIKWRG